VVTAAFVAYAAPALAAAGPTDEQLSVTGSLAYAWHGDPARGCAAAGLCAVSGALTVEPLGYGDFAPFGGRQDLFIDVTSTVRVRRDDGDAAPAECVDTFGGNGGLDAQLIRRGSATVAALQPGFSSARCAGPLAADLAKIELPVKRTGRRHPTFDLRGTRFFTAGPFSGTMVSTLRFEPAAGAGQSSSGGSGSFFGGGGPPSHRVLVEHVDLSYRVEPLPGALQIGFGGPVDSSCEVLDACGATGSLALSVGSPPGTIQLSASREVRARVSSSHALADFRAGRLPLGFAGFAQLPTRVLETFSWPGAAECHDSAAAPALGLMVGSDQVTLGRRVPVTLANQSGIDIFRTHCPGPADADVIGESQNGEIPIAGTAVTTRELLAPRTVLSLPGRGAFGGLGYTGTRGGALKVELARVSVSAGTNRQSQ
jgi:hypothetical protein